MICLTGDIHHASLRTGNQRHADISEVECARRFLAMTSEAGVKVTFFVSGKCFAEEWDALAPVATDETVELGGHNWSCFQPELLHRTSKKLLGSYNGPPFLQRLDARRTIDIVRHKTGRWVTLWRNHMYMHGPFTERALAREGIVLCSDGTDRDAMGPVKHPAGIYNFPLNVIPDHEHLYHAERTREWVEAWQRRYQWSDDWGPGSYEIDEWVELVLEDLRRNEERGAISNMIIHPITMYLCDNFRGFERILEFLSTRRTAHLSEALGGTR